MATTDELRAAHWRNFIYRHTARHWHALWCRWSPDAQLKTCFHAERIFKPVGDEGETEMAVVYHYDDERGTVREGPQCGPWRINERVHSASDGMLHPSSTDMTTLLLPAGGPSAWCMKRSASGCPCAVELFLHHGEHLRMSAGVIHSKEGDLVQLSCIREDARAPFPSPDWSTSTGAQRVDAAQLVAALHDASAPTECEGTGCSITADLYQQQITGRWQSTRMAAACAGDVALLCPDAIAIVAPAKRIVGEPFSSATAWWPPCADGTQRGPTLYTIEAHWNADGELVEVRLLTFRRPDS